MFLSLLLKSGILERFCSCEGLTVTERYELTIFSREEGGFDHLTLMGV